MHYHNQTCQIYKRGEKKKKQKKKTKQKQTKKNTFAWCSTYIVVRGSNPLECCLYLKQIINHYFLN